MCGTNSLDGTRMVIATCEGSTRSMGKTVATCSRQLRRAKLVNKLGGGESVTHTSTNHRDGKIEAVQY